MRVFSFFRSSFNIVTVQSPLYFQGKRKRNEVNYCEDSEEDNEATHAAEAAPTKLGKTSSRQKNWFGVQAKSLAERVKFLEAENVKLRERLKAMQLRERLEDNWVLLILHRLAN